jgi:hypothetical protein
MVDHLASGNELERARGRDSALGEQVLEPAAERDASGGERHAGFVDAKALLAPCEHLVDAVLGDGEQHVRGHGRLERDGARSREGLGVEGHVVEGESCGLDRHGVEAALLEGDVDASEPTGDLCR